MKIIQKHAKLEQKMEKAENMKFCLNCRKPVDWFWKPVDWIKPVERSIAPGENISTGLARGAAARSA